MDASTAQSVARGRYDWHVRHVVGDGHQLALEQPERFTAHGLPFLRGSVPPRCDSDALAAEDECAEP